MLYYTLCKQLQVYTELSQLIPWLQILVNQLPQQRLVAATKEQLQVQSDWLKVSYMYIIVITWVQVISLKHVYV